MTDNDKLLLIGIVAVFILGGATVAYFINHPIYSDAVVGGTVYNRWQGGSAWYLNVTLDKNTFDDLQPLPASGPGPVLVTRGSDGNIHYIVRVACDFFKAGDKIDLRVPVEVQSNRPVQYNYGEVGAPYHFPEVYKLNNAGGAYFPVAGC